MKRRILSFDGGGMKGLISIAFLNSPPKDFPDLDSFDMLAGTSIGGINALGIRMGLSPAAMIDFYQTKGPQIFPRGPRRVKIFRPNRYRIEGFEKALRSIFGTRRLREIPRAVFVPALDWKAAQRQNAPFFFTEQSPYSYFDTARSTTAAPSYFKAYPLHQRLLIDGGLCMNNPTVGAVTRARYLWPNEELEVWSIGTGREPSKVHKYPWTTLAMLDDIVELSMQGSAGITHKEMKLDPTISYVRYDFDLGRNVCMDDARQKTLDHYLALGRNPIKEADTRSITNTSKGRRTP